jgi:hypothetical protein
MKDQREYTIEDMLKPTAAEVFNAAEPLVTDISKLLTGKHPEVVGATLAHLTATWIMGFSPNLRDPMIDIQFITVKTVVQQRTNEREGGRN